MAGEIVMRSVFLRPEDDTTLKELAYRMNVSKNDLARLAVAEKLEEWRQDDSDEVLQRDLALAKKIR